SAEEFFFDFDFDSNEELPDGKTRADYSRSQYNPTRPEFLRVFQHFLIESLVVGRADGTIRLTTSDPSVAPAIDLGLDRDDDACERMARGILLMRDVLSHSAIKKYHKPEVFPGPQYSTLEQLIDYLKRWSAFGHHISGTAQMGILEKNPNAVVDS